MDYRKYVLAELRCSRLRSKLITNEIETVGMALKGGLISEDDAVAWMNEIGALELLQWDSSSALPVEAKSK